MISKTIKSATILNVDCMEYMRSLPDKYFDLAVCDPPYGISVNMNAGRKKTAARVKRENKKWDDASPSENYFNLLFKSSDNQVIWGGNYFPLKLTGAWLFWDKQVAPEASFSDGELAWRSFGNTLHKCVIPWSGFIGSDGERIHPTQKPVKLYEWILTNYAKPGQTIFDSHMGSGSSAIAAINLGFEYVGCELDADYYEAACKRIEQHAAQERLFS